MLEGMKQTGIALGVGFFSLMVLSAFAESPKIAMGESVLLQGSAKVLVEPKNNAMAPLTSGHSLEIDQETRVLGGTTDLSGARHKQFPAQKFPFFISPDQITDNLQLTIGYIRGINTPEAHESGQSTANFVSSPAVIKVNGVRIQYIYTDGELIKVTIPRGVLQPHGFNVLQVEAGFYFLPGNRVAYDELQMQHLSLSY